MLRPARARGLADEGRRQLDEPVLSDWPLPRIWTPEEPPTNPHGYRLEPGDFGLSADPRTERIRERLAELR